MKGIIRGVFLGSFQSKRGNIFYRVLDQESSRIILVASSGVGSDGLNCAIGDKVVIEVDFLVRFANLIKVININK
jgi:hypothetical protein